MQTTHRYLAVTLVALMGGLLASTVATAQDKEAAGRRNVKMSAPQAGHVMYMSKHKLTGVPYRLNPADPEQYAYIVEMLQMGGLTPQTNPDVYKGLIKARMAKASPAMAVTQADMPAGSSGAVLGGINYTSQFGVESASATYRTASISTYPSNQVPVQTSLVTALIDVDNNISLNSNSASFQNATNVQVSTTAGAPADHSDIQSNTLFGVMTSATSGWAYYSEVLNDFKAVANPCQLSPNFSPTRGTNQQCNTSAATTCVNGSTPPTTAIKLCYGNRIQSDCDYGCTGSSNPTNIVFPIKGNVDLQQTPTNPLTGSLYIVMASANGGGCVLTAQSGTMGGLTGLITMNGTVASWNFAPASFPQNATNPCLTPTNSGTLFNYVFQLYVMTSSGGVGANFTSKSSDWGNLDTYAVPQINVVIGCLPAGVRIRLADGSEKKIETFQANAGDLVRSAPIGAATGAANALEAYIDPAGNPLSPAKLGQRSVQATTTGTELLPLVSIRDDKGHALLLTEEHPVMTSLGAVTAKTLKVGDDVMTELGLAVLVEVSRKVSLQPVPIYNIAIGTDEEAEKDQTTFFANGILVGDQRMQQSLANRPALHSVPTAWPWSHDLLTPIHIP